MPDLFDDIIVGAGSAGCVLANRLSEDPARRVLLLEAGDRFLVRMPKGMGKLIPDPSVAWHFQVEQPRVPGVPTDEMLARGKMLGGSSSINGHIYNRGQRLDFDGWAQRGNRGWGYSDVLPYFRRSENRMAGDADAIRATNKTSGALVTMRRAAEPSYLCFKRNFIAVLFLHDHTNA